MKTHLMILGLLIIALAACSPPLPTATTPAAFPTDEEIEVRAVVEEFGRRLQNVSLLSPTAAEDIETQYSEFVLPELLQTWVANSSPAPGRLTSSPWPDHIEIIGIERQADEAYLVTGFIVETTSTAEAARQAVELRVESVGGNWLITEFTAGEYE